MAGRHERSPGLFEYKTDPWASSQGASRSRGDQEPKIGDFVIIQNQVGVNKILNGRGAQIVGSTRGFMHPTFYWKLKLHKPILWLWRHTYVDKYTYGSSIRVVSPLEALAGQI